MCPWEVVGDRPPDDAGLFGQASSAAVSETGPPMGGSPGTLQSGHERPGRRGLPVNRLTSNRATPGMISSDRHISLTHLAPWERFPWQQRR